MLPALVLPVLAASSAGANMLYGRTVDDIWGGVNVTKASLDVFNAISSPTCNATQYCVEFATKVVPRCLSLQGTAGCWCTLHDPLHYCALCMSNPTDNTTTPQQTQTSTTAHQDYHKACGAWIASVNATASSVSSSATASPSGTAVSSTSSSSSLSTGGMVGAIIGGIGGLILLLVLAFLLYRHMQNKAAAKNAKNAAHATTPLMSPKMSVFTHDRASTAPSSTLTPVRNTPHSDMSRLKSTETFQRPFNPSTNANGYDTSLLEGTGYSRAPEL